MLVDVAPPRDDLRHHLRDAAGRVGRARRGGGRGVLGDRDRRDGGQEQGGADESHDHTIRRAAGRWPSPLVSGPMKATRKEWIGLGVIALPCLLYSMDLTVLHMAVPQLSRDLDPSSTELLWIIDIYGFMVAGFLIAAGTLGDRIGRRKLLMIGAAMFGLASVAAAYSRTAEMLIVTRALLGIAGATVAPSTLSLIRNMFHDEHERTRAISVWITAYSLGGIVGPLIGGVLLERFFWGSVFLIAVPPMALLLVVGPMLLPEYKDPQARLPDFPSALLSLAAVL